jgi:hypothetical protein
MAELAARDYVLRHDVLAGSRPAYARDASLTTYLVNDGVNQMLIEHLEPAAGKAKLPISKPSSEVRTLSRERFL